jgi:hypothetical protein
LHIFGLVAFGAARLTWSSHCLFLATIASFEFIFVTVGLKHIHYAVSSVQRCPPKFDMAGCCIVREAPFSFHPLLLPKAGVAATVKTGRLAHGYIFYGEMVLMANLEFICMLFEKS